MVVIKEALIGAVVLLFSANLFVSADDFPVTIIHLNDFHARFEETSLDSNVCKHEQGDTCIGGYARVVSKVRELKQTKAHLNPIYLNAADNFQGTLWYNIFRWNATSYFLNLEPADAMTIGNHEFDHGVEGLIPFLETIDPPTKIVVANLDISEEPGLQGLYSHTHVIDRYERRIGIIGVILQTTNTISDTGKLKFLDETETVKAEAAKLKADGIDIIIVLSHSGLDVDQIIAANCGPDIDVIVGGHTHTFLFTGSNSPGPDTPRGDYPTIVTQADGHQVYVVQASAYTKYLGDITFWFDDAGKIVRHEGAPIFLDDSVQPDPEIVAELEPWKEIVDGQGKRLVGESKVQLKKSDCSRGECNIGSLIADSFVHAYVKKAEPGSWTYASIAFTNNGGIRTDLAKGTITYSELIAAMPFDNSVDVVELQGKHLWETFEYALHDSYYTLQTSGIRYEADVTKAAGQRLLNMTLLCNECLVPKYELIDLEKWYRVIVPDFTANGGDGFTAISDNKRSHITGPIDNEVFQEFINIRSPVIYPIAGRAIIHGLN